MSETGVNAMPDGIQPRNKNWIWLFVVMFSLAAIAAGINLTYNLKQQLTPEQLGNAKRLWEHTGLKDYDLVIKKDVAAGTDRSIKDVLRVTVRNRTVTDLQLNDQPLARRLWSQYDMDGWFGWLERNLEIDQQPKASRVFCVAHFDLEDGHIIKYVRSVRDTNERQELNIELKKP